MTSVSLVPGVNVERTLAANEAGVSQSQLIRYKDGMIQAYGWWQPYISASIPSTVRVLHAWQDATGLKHVGVGATQSLSVITNGSNNDITPQTLQIDSTGVFSLPLGSTTITVTLPNSSGVPSIYNSIFLNTPVSVAGQIITGARKILSVLSTDSFTISANYPATAAVVNGGFLPTLSSTLNSPSITVDFQGNTFKSVVGLFYPFYAPTSLTSNLVIQGPYQITSVVDSTRFIINATQSASATVGPVTMNSSKVEMVFYVSGGPNVSGTGWSAGTWGGGTWGGVVSGGAAPTPGNPITAIDWTMDNWGEILLACPEDGPVYSWSPDNGITTAQVVTGAPFFNGGIFVAMPIQILVCWRSCQTTPVDSQTNAFGAQNALLVVWSDSGDFTNFEASDVSAAGAFQIPTGSMIVGGFQAATQGLIWTDVDIWNMVYVGGDLTFQFNRLGSGCGLIGKHAMGTLGGNVYWCGTTSFFVLGGGGVVPLPCSVWDFIFQNLDTTNQSKIVCATNTAFNEVAWFFPSVNAGGENDSYVKYNIIEQEWDYGALARTAWIDVNIAGTPIGSDTFGNIYQHETGTSFLGANLPSFRTGYWAVSDGNDLAFVDFIIPDFIWGTYAGAKDAQLFVNVYMTDYLGDMPRSYGPFPVNSTTEYIALRARGRFMSIQITSSTSEFFRLGRTRFRYAIAGRR